jgi:hypothetical protein
MANQKVKNCYALAVGVDLLDEIPKAVWAAIAISALTCGGDCLDEGALRAAREWDALYHAGIVPQKPGPIARGLIAAQGSV